MCAPLLGRLADRHGLVSVVILLLGVMILATCQTLALPQAGRHDQSITEFPLAPVDAAAMANEERIALPGEAI
jgi:hypothetical protein